MLARKEEEGTRRKESRISHYYMIDQGESESEACEIIQV